MIFSFLKNLSSLTSSSLTIPPISKCLLGAFFFYSMHRLVFHMLETRNRLSPKLFHLFSIKNVRARAHIHKICAIEVFWHGFHLYTRCPFFFSFLFLFGSSSAHSHSHLMRSLFVSIRLHFNCKVFVYRTRCGMVKRKIENELKTFIFSLFVLFVRKMLLENIQIHHQQQWMVRWHTVRRQHNSR